ncbi:MAG: 4-phosphoerythronate dehydrogenase [Muribaculaceae bacterium]|nr:4-phosphoerythronate dehydrogenase [Muribaculaceae bacterium]
MRIIADDNIPFLRGRLEAVAEVEYTDQWGFTPELVKDADAIVIRTRTRCDRALLEGSKVRLIATATIGMDQIDLEWCARQGITIRNAPGCNAPGVAQYVWSALLRMGFDPTRHTVGRVGCGNVGSIVRDWGLSLGARVLVSDPPREEAGLPGDYTPLDTLLKESDAVTLHTPLTHTGSHKTHHLIGEQELSLIGDGRILVNAARGAVVDFNALRRHVTSGRIRAAIDTWEGEPEVDREILDAVEYGTFHIAGYSRQGKERATHMAIEAIEETFGVSIDKSGLTPAYEGTPGLTAEKITRSYDPADDTAMLRNAPGEFDTLRRDYKYREEA